MEAAKVKTAPRNFSPKYFHRFDRITSCERIERGIELGVDVQFCELLRVEVIRDGIIRLRMSRSQKFDEMPTYAVCADLAAEKPEFHIDETDSFIRVRTS